jgi:hypothetical protein
MSGTGTSAICTSLPFSPRGAPTTRLCAMQRLWSMLSPIQRRKTHQRPDATPLPPCGVSCRPPRLWQNMTIRRHDQAAIASATFPRTSGGNLARMKKRSPPSPCLPCLRARSYKVAVLRWGLPCQDCLLLYPVRYPRQCVLYPCHPCLGSNWLKSPANTFRRR